jgi:hypothetical protein
LDKLQGKVVSKSVEDYLDSLIEKKADFAEEMGSDDNVIDRETIRAAYVVGTAIIQEKKSKAIASKLITIPSTGEEHTLVFEYEITKIEGEKYYLECIKSVDFLQEGNLVKSTFPKGEKAIYEAIFNKGKKKEIWTILSY